MANNIKLKRSAVPGKMPTTTDLALGELAVNTYDGKVFLKKNNGTESIISLGEIGYTGSQGVAGYTGSQGSIGYTGSAGGSSLTFSDTPPSSPTVGAMWLHSTTGIKYTFIDDGTSTQWVELESESIGLTPGEPGPSVPSVYSAEYSLQGSTSNATETEIFVGGVSGQRIPVNTNTALSYTVEITCRRTDTVGDYGSWFVKGLVINNAGAVSDVGSLYEVVVARTDASMVVDIRADDTNNAIAVFVTGATGKTVSWKAVVTVIEV